MFPITNNLLWSPWTLTIRSRWAPTCFHFMISGSSTNTTSATVVDSINTKLFQQHSLLTEKCPRITSAQCKNGGFPHPRDCNTCICPSGYGGALCDERVCWTSWLFNIANSLFPIFCYSISILLQPKGCGQTYQAKTTKQMLVDRNGFHGSLRPDYNFCNYWIEVFREYLFPTWPHDMLKQFI